MIFVDQVKDSVRSYFAERDEIRERIRADEQKTRENITKFNYDFFTFLGNIAGSDFGKAMPSELQIDAVKALANGVTSSPVSWMKERMFSNLINIGGLVRSGRYVVQFKSRWDPISQYPLPLLVNGRCVYKTGRMAEIPAVRFKFFDKTPDELDFLERIGDETTFSANAERAHVAYSSGRRESFFKIGEFQDRVVRTDIKRNTDSFFVYAHCNKSA